MIHGFAFILNDKDICMIDYSRIIRFGNGSVNINLPNSFKPVSQNQYLKLCNGQINLNMMGIKLSSYKLIELWELLENEGFPLDKISESLLVEEITVFLKNHFLPVVTSQIMIIKLIYAMHCCSGIKGFLNRKNKLKRTLKGITKKQLRFDNDIEEIKRAQDPNDYLKNTTDILIKLNNALDEFTIGSLLHKYFKNIQFSDDEGKPDFIVDDKQIEAKLRIRFDPDWFSQKEIRLSESVMLSLLCKEALPQIISAFDNQNADLVIVNLSINNYGQVFALGIADIGTKLLISIEQADKLMKENKKPVIIYSIINGSHPESYSIVLERKTIEHIGSNLDKIEKEYIKEVKHTSFYSYLSSLSDKFTQKNSSVKIKNMKISDLNFK